MSSVVQTKHGLMEVPDRFTSKHFWEAAEHVFKITNASGQSGMLGKMLAQAAATEAEREAGEAAGGAKW